MSTSLNPEVTENENTDIESISDLKLKEINLDEINLIKELWKKLNKLHSTECTFFKEAFAKNTFEKRCAKFRRLNSDEIKIDVVENKNSRIIGYCISSINAEIGEIDSLIIEDSYRKLGLGTLLISSAIKWLKINNCERIQLSVGYGREEVFEFYRKAGFYPRVTYLELK